MSYSRITEKHRLFFVDDVMEFAFFFNPLVTDKQEIIKELLAEKDWKWYVDYFKIKVASITVSDDLKEVRILTIQK